MAAATNQAKPIGLLIAAMGGEGGGVLRQWLVDAAMAEGFAVQSTSIPGVAQRTGATTYYIEMQGPDGGDGGGRRPIMSLYPLAGSVDIMVASELIEAGRAMQNGFVTPNCTTLIASWISTSTSTTTCVCCSCCSISAWSSSTGSATT